MSAKSLTKFVILTRGRTGSTAIVDETNQHQDISCKQEVFVSLRVTPLYALYQKYGTSFEEYGFNEEWFPIFALWLKQFKKSRLLSKVNFLKKIYNPLNIRRVNRYLDELENHGVNLGCEVLGFKLLEHQVAEIPGFIALLKQRNYKVIYLERKNVVRQVLSGVIANKRKKFNAKNYQSDGQLYELDLNNFKSLIEGELHAIRSQKKMVEGNGFDSLLINYEDFLNNRPEFFKEIFEFLGVDNVLPEGSDFSIMIPNVKDVVKNYDEFYACIEGMGMREYIES
ncbi:hypothetical protein [Cycloclasticus zancles]|uniref:Sulfotransferase n=1 Tax=Cycloclasticus zancles 78-ME TaxID=1198232 RepID=S5TUU3_9GAMM|nr:hypothetical protein [Cycloclasticus zancles]AGS38788.1 hypothetical protein CYCME_0447 [Cycloclasticus zancles 78-ME]